MCLGLHCDYSEVYLDYSGSVDLTDDDVKSIVDLIRANGGETDVDALGLEEKYPDIYEKLCKAQMGAASEVNYRHWLIEGYEKGGFEELDNFVESIEAAGLFKYEPNFDALRDDWGLEKDEEIDEDDLEDAKREAFDEWVSEYYNSLNEDGKVGFIETYYGDVMDQGEPGDYEITLKIPQGIIDLANVESN
jgi:hypothetical protein